MQFLFVTVRCSKCRFFTLHISAYKLGSRFSKKHTPCRSPSPTSPESEREAMKGEQHPVFGRIKQALCKHCHCLASYSGLLHLAEFGRNGVVRTAVRSCPFCNTYVIPEEWVP